MSNNNVAPIIIKRKKVVAGDGHHGGAWKVAYADFVTAMMAFFLLMWLLSATTEEQREGLSDYFSPTIPLTDDSSGGDSVFNGEDPLRTQDWVRDGEGGADTELEGDVPIRTVAEQDDQDRATTEFINPPAPATAEGVDDEQMDWASTDEGLAERMAEDEGRAADPLDTLSSEPAQDDLAQDPLAEAAEDALAELAAEDGLGAGDGSGEDANLSALESAFQDAKAANPDDPLMQHLSMRMTPKGLVIEIADTEGDPLFGAASANPSDTMRILMDVVAPILASIENSVEIVGHTDATPFGPNSRRTNWDLSTDRANAARGLLVEAGFPEDRLARVSGAADREPLVEDAYAAQNRRIAITLLREDPAASAPGADGASTTNPTQP